MQFELEAARAEVGDADAGSAGLGRNADAVHGTIGRAERGGRGPEEGAATDGEVDCEAVRDGGGRDLFGPVGRNQQPDAARSCAGGRGERDDGRGDRLPRDPQHGSRRAFEFTRAGKLVERARRGPEGRHAARRVDVGQLHRGLALGLMHQVFASNFKGDLLTEGEVGRQPNTLEFGLRIDGARGRASRGGGSRQARCSW